MSAPVDVLAVIDRAFGAADEHYLDLRSSDDKPLGPAYDRSCRYLKEHREARAAVAELILAAGDADHAFTDGAKHPFLLRIRAALARVKGGAA